MGNTPENVLKEYVKSQKFSSTAQIMGAMGNSVNSEPEVPEVKRKKKTIVAADNIKEFGSAEIPTAKTNIHVMSIIGQIEGHVIFAPNNKTTRYEHIMPQFVAIEQNPEIEENVFI